MGPNGNETTTQLRVLSSLFNGPDAHGGNEDRLIFGLGATGVPEELTVTWPHLGDEWSTRIDDRQVLQNAMNNMSKLLVIDTPSVV